MNIENKNYFRLNTYIHLVSEGETGKIYNLISGNIYSLDIEKNSLLRKCESNIPLNEIENVDMDFLDLLYRQNMGRYYKLPVHVEKPTPGKNQEIESLQPDNTKIETLFVELDNKCNFNCVFCKEGDNTLYRKTGCKRWPCNGKIENLETWKSVIYQITNLNCNKVVFIGAEPLLSYSMIKELTGYIRQKTNIKDICIYTNVSQLDEEKIAFLKENNISLSVQIFSCTNNFQNEITKTEGQLDLVESNLKLLDKNNIKYKLCVLINRLNEDEVESIVKHHKILKRNIEVEFLYPKPHNIYYSKKFLGLMYNKKNNLQDTKLNLFFYLQKFHNCYGNQLAITANGEVIPCIMSRQLILGNVRNDTIVSILNNSNYERYKRMTKDKITSCKKCSFRYGCFDCRAIEMSATNNLYGMEYCNLKNGLDERNEKDECCG